MGSRAPQRPDGPLQGHFFDRPRVGRARHSPEGRTLNGEASPEWLLVVEAVLSADADVDAFHRWYDHVHLPEISSCPGFHGGIRYAAFERSPDEGSRFLALYRIDGPEALASAEFAARRGFGPFADQVKFTTRVYARHEPSLPEGRAA